MFSLCLRELDPGKEHSNTRFEATLQHKQTLPVIEIQRVAKRFVR